MVRVPPRMELDCVSTKVASAPDTVTVRVDEEAAPDARADEPSYRAFQAVWITCDIKPTFGRHLLTTFRDNRCFVRPQPLGEFDDRVAERHLEVQVRADASGEPFHVGVLNVSSIFPQVRGNAIGPGIFADSRGRQRIRFLGATRLTNRGDVIDVDEQTLIRGVHVSVRFHGLANSAR